MKTEQEIKQRLTTLKSWSFSGHDTDSLKAEIRMLERCLQ
jgi:hypothetical protein